jgi:hypothetical protein
VKVHYPDSEENNCMNSSRTLLALAAIVCVLVGPRPAYADEDSLVQSPDGAFRDSLSIDYDNQQRALRQTGQTVRRQYFLQIYAMAHYLEDALLDPGEPVYTAIVESPGIKQITMVFLRNLRGSQIRDSLSASLRSNTGKDRYAVLQPDIDRFMSAIDGDVQRGDEFVLRWYPDGTMDSIHQGNTISSIRNTELARSMWAIWFGEKSVVDRAALVDRL